MTEFKPEACIDQEDILERVTAYLEEHERNVTPDILAKVVQECSEELAGQIEDEYQSAIERVNDQMNQYRLSELWGYINLENIVDKLTLPPEIPEQRRQKLFREDAIEQIRRLMSQCDEFAANPNFQYVLALSNRIAAFENAMSRLPGDLSKEEMKALFKQAKDLEKETA